MLFKETIRRDTLELLSKLMLDRRLASFNLAGGTALALYLGHRISIDLDLFTDEYFEAALLEKHLTELYNFKGDMLDTNTLKGSINGVKVDFIRHDYLRLQEIVLPGDNFRLYSMTDISAMKLSAISDNGTRLKDFIDIAFLSCKLSLLEMLNAYQLKYPNSNSMRALKALAYFDNINLNEPIVFANGIYQWNLIKERIFAMIENDSKIFDSFPV